MADNGNQTRGVMEPRYRLSLGELLDRAEIARARTRQLIDQQRAMSGEVKGRSSPSQLSHAASKSEQEQLLLASG